MHMEKSDFDVSHLSKGMQPLNYDFDYFQGLINNNKLKYKIANGRRQELHQNIKEISKYESVKEIKTNYKPKLIE